MDTAKTENHQILQNRVQKPDIRIRSANPKFAQTDKELVELHLKCFKHYLTSTVGYSNQEPEDRESMRILIKLFKHYIKESNIRNFCNHSAKEIYLGIINNNLQEKVANIGFNK